MALEGTLEGTLQDFPLPDIIQLLSLSRKTGAVEIRGSDGFGTGKLYFHLGKVVSAALEDMPPLEAAYSFFTFSGGSFLFHDNEPPGPPGPPITVSNEFLIMEGIRRADEWEKLRVRVASPDLILGLVADPVAGNRDINLKPDEWRVLTVINGRDSIRQIARGTGFGDFKTTRIIYHLLSAGLIEPLGMADFGAPLPPNLRAPASPPGPPAPIPPRQDAQPRPAPPPGPAAQAISGPELYARLEAISIADLGNTGRLMLSDTYRRMRLPPGGEIRLDAALKLCVQFERDAGMLVGSNRGRLLAEKLRRAVNEFFTG